MALALFDSVLLPSIIIFSIITIDLMQWFQTKRFKMSEVATLAIFFMAFCAPVTAFGVFTGFNKPKYEVANKPSRIRNSNAKREFSCFVNPLLCFLVNSIVPFTVIAYSFYQIFSNISGGRHLYVFQGALHFSFALMTVLVVMVAILTNYVHLCHGRAGWPWRAFIFGASIGLCLFAVSTYHLIVELRILHISTLITYIVIEVVVCSFVGLAMGTAASAGVFFFN